MLQLRNRGKEEKLREKREYEAIVNLSALAGSSGFFVNVFFDGYKGRVCGCRSTRLPGRFIRERVAFARRYILGTRYGRREHAIRFRTVFLTGLAKRSSPANGRSGYWFSMADQRGAKQKVPTRQSPADRCSTQQSRDNIVDEQTRIPCSCDSLINRATLESRNI